MVLAVHHVRVVVHRSVVLVRWRLVVKVRRHGLVVVVSVGMHLGVPPVVEM